MHPCLRSHYASELIPPLPSQGRGQGESFLGFTSVVLQNPSPKSSPLGVKAEAADNKSTFVTSRWQNL